MAEPARRYTDEELYIVPDVKPRTSAYTDAELHIVGKPQPYRYEDIIARVARQYDIDPLLVQAVIQRESSFDPKIVSKAGAKGLMQLMDPTAKEMGVEDSFDPEQNITGGVRYLRQLLDLSNGDVGKALLWYVSGRDPAKWGAQSFAYPGLVLDAYEKLGGRRYPTDLSALAGAKSIPKAAGTLGIAANAVLPFVSAPEVVMEGARQAQRGWENVTSRDWWFGSPDRPRRSFADIFRQGMETEPTFATPLVRLGTTLEESATGRPPTGLAADDINAFRESLALAREQNPLKYMLTSTAAAVPGELLLGGFVGNALTRGAEAVAGIVPQARRAVAYLSGTHGYGKPVTAEGASFVGRRAGEAVRGGVQGAVAGSSFAHNYPETPFAEQALQGAVIGAGTAPVIGGGLELAGNALLGTRIDPAIARLGQQARGTQPAPSGYTGEALNLRRAPLAPNNLAIRDPKQFSRLAWETAGVARPPVTAAEVEELGRQLAGQIDSSAALLPFTLDRQFWNAVAQIRAQTPEEVFRLPGWRTTLRGLTDKWQDGTLTAADLRAVLKKGSPLSSMLRASDVNVQTAARQLRDALQDSLTRTTAGEVERLLTAGATAEAQLLAQRLHQFHAARARYRNFATLVEAKDPLTELIDIPRLEAAVSRHFGSVRQYPGGRLGELARYGRAFNPALEGSVFAPTYAERGRGSALAAAVGGAAGAAGAAGPFLAGAAAARGMSMAGRALKATSGRMPWAVPLMLQRSTRQGPGAIVNTALPLSVTGAADMLNATLASPPEFQARAENKLMDMLPTRPASWVPTLSR